MTKENFQKERTQKGDVADIFQTEATEKDRTIRTKRRTPKSQSILGPEIKGLVKPSIKLKRLN